MCANRQRALSLVAMARGASQVLQLLLISISFVNADGNAGLPMSPSTLKQSSDMMHVLMVGMIVWVTRFSKPLSEFHRCNRWNVSLRPYPLDKQRKRG